MTTKVTIEAHCSPDKEVRIYLKYNGNDFIESIQDTESKEYYIYDNITIKVKEEFKK
jgi:hypothetical protein